MVFFTSVFLWQRISSTSCNIYNVYHLIQYFIMLCHMLHTPFYVGCYALCFIYVVYDGVSNTSCILPFVLCFIIHIKVITLVFKSHTPDSELQIQHPKPIFWCALWVPGQLCGMYSIRWYIKSKLWELLILDPFRSQFRQKYHSSPPAWISGTIVSGFLVGQFWLWRCF